MPLHKRETDDEAFCSVYCTFQCYMTHWTFDRTITRRGNRSKHTGHLPWTESLHQFVEYFVGFRILFWDGEPALGLIDRDLELVLNPCVKWVPMYAFQFDEGLGLVRVETVCMWRGMSSKCDVNKRKRESAPDRICCKILQQLLSNFRPRRFVSECVDSSWYKWRLVDAQSVRFITTDWYYLNLLSVTNVASKHAPGSPTQLQRA